MEEQKGRQGRERGENTGCGWRGESPLQMSKILESQSSPKTYTNGLTQDSTSERSMCERFQVDDSEKTYLHLVLTLVKDLFGFRLWVFVLFFLITFKNQFCHLTNMLKYICHLTAFINLGVHSLLDFRVACSVWILSTPLSSVSLLCSSLPIVNGDLTILNGKFQK